MNTDTPRLDSGTVFVTGGTGFLGRHLIPALCRAGLHAHVLARRPEAHPWLHRYPQVKVIAGDVLDAETLARGIEGCRYVMHAAGYFRFWGEDAAFERVNVYGTANVLRAAESAGVERFIYMSTIAVIGHPQPDRVVDEMHPAEPADAYQWSKLRAETLVRAAAAEGRVPGLILRGGAFYGPHGTYAFNRLFFRDPLRGLIMQVNGGRYVIFPAYIRDVSEAVILALARGRAGEIYNICGEPITHREAFDIVCAEANLRYPRIPLPGWLGIGMARVLTGLATLTRREPFYPINLRSYVYNYWRVSNEKARRELGFTPIDFHEGARRTLAWYRAGQPEWSAEVEC